MAEHPDRQLMLPNNRMRRGHAMSCIGLGVAAQCSQSIGLGYQRCRAQKYTR